MSHPDTFPVLNHLHSSRSTHNHLIHKPQEFFLLYEHIVMVPVPRMIHRLESLGMRTVILVSQESRHVFEAIMVQRRRQDLGDCRVPGKKHTVGQACTVDADQDVGRLVELELGFEIEGPVVQQSHLDVRMSGLKGVEKGVSMKQMSAVLAVDHDKLLRSIWCLR